MSDYERYRAERQAARQGVAAPAETISDGGYGAWKAERNAKRGAKQAGPKMPIADALNVQSKQGFDWGTTDESRGVQAAMGLPATADRALRLITPGVPVANIGLGVGGIISEGKGKMPEAYTKARDAERADVKQAWEDRPVTSFVGQTASSAAYPGGAMKAGAPVLKESLKMAFLGLLQGGTYGYASSEGDTADRIEGAKMGGTLGAVFGSALPGGTAAVTPLIRSGKGTLAKGIDMVGGMFGKNPGAESAHAQQVAKAAVERSMNRSGMTPEKIMEAIDKFGDKPAVLAEVIGQDAVNALTALTRAPGSTAQKAQDIITERFGGFAGRAADDLRATTGLTDQQIAGNFDAEIAKRQAEAAPAYQSLFEQQGGVASPRLDQLSGTNTLKGKISNAEKAASDLAVARGRDPASVSRLEVLDTAKRSLDDDIAKAVKNQDREEAMRLQSMQTALLNELDTLTGGQYAAARDLGGEAPRIISAFEQGSKAMRPSVSRRTVTEQANALRPQDRPAYAAGVASKIDEDIANGRMAPQRFRLPANQEKVAAAFGEDAGGNFTKRMQAEAELRDLGARWGPRMNSVTGTVLENSGGGMAEEAIGIAASLARGDKVGLIQKAMRFMRQRGFSEAERNAMGDLLLSNPQEGLRRLGIQLPTPGGAAPANALAQPTRGKPPEPNTARDPQNVRAQFEHPGDIDGYDAAGNARFKAGSKGEAMARGVNAFAKDESGFIRPDATSTLMSGSGATVGALNPIDFDGDGKTSPQERAMTAALYGGGAFAVGKGMKGLDRLGRAPQGAATEFRVRPGESGSSRIQFRAGGERWETLPTAFGSAEEAASQVQRLQAGKPLQADVIYGAPSDEFEAMFRNWWEQTQGTTAPRFAEAVQNNNGMVQKAIQEMDPSGEAFAGFLKKYMPDEWAQYMGPGGGADGKAVDAAVSKALGNLNRELDSMTRPSGSSAGRDFNLETWSPNKPKAGPGGNGIHADIMANQMKPRPPSFTGGPLGQMRNALANNAPPVPGRPPKVQKDFPISTRKAGKKPDLKGTIQKTYEQTTGTPIAIAIDDPKTIKAAAKTDAINMMERGVDPHRIYKDTNYVPIEYRGQRAVVFSRDATPETVWRDFFDGVENPGTNPWVDQLMQGWGFQQKTLNLGSRNTPIRLGGPKTPMVREGNQNAFARSKK